MSRRRFRLLITDAERKAIRRDRWYLLAEFPLLLVFLSMVGTRNWGLAVVFGMAYMAFIWRVDRRRAAMNDGPAPLDPASLDPRSAFWLDPGTAFRRLTGRDGRRGRGLTGYQRGLPATHSNCRSASPQPASALQNPGGRLGRRCAGGVHRTAALGFVERLYLGQLPDRLPVGPLHSLGSIGVRHSSLQLLRVAAQHDGPEVAGL